MSVITGYKVVNLKNTIGTTAEERIDSILSSYSCPQNRDVECFLKNKAKEFARQNIATTYLVFAAHKEKPALIGYFTLANKVFAVSKRKIKSKTLQRRIHKFGELNEAINAYTLSAPLIAQLGKNFKNKYNELIKGDELLKLACDKVAEAQSILSGKLTYVECEDVECLINFYTSNGFQRIADRELSQEEKGAGTKDYLVQLIKYIK